MDNIEREDSKKAKCDNRKKRAIKEFIDIAQNGQESELERIHSSGSKNIRKIISRKQQQQQPTNQPFQWVIKWKKLAMGYDRKAGNN